LEDLLELALRVHVHRLEAEVFDVGLGFIDDETVDGFEAAIDIHGADQGLEGIRQGGRADTAAAGFLAFAHHEKIAEADGDGVNLEPLPRDEAGAHFCKLALGAIGKRLNRCSVNTSWRTASPRNSRRWLSK